MAKEKSVSGKGKISREDFEAFKFGVERLKALEAELNLLDTKAFPYEATSIRKKLKDVSLIPVIERELSELKLKIEGKAPRNKAVAKRKVVKKVKVKAVKPKKKAKPKKKVSEKVSKERNARLKRARLKRIKAKEEAEAKKEAELKKIKLRNARLRKARLKSNFSNIEKDFKKGFGKDIKRITG